MCSMCAAAVCPKPRRRSTTASTPGRAPTSPHSLTPLARPADYPGARRPFHGRAHYRAHRTPRAHKPRGLDVGRAGRPARAPVPRALPRLSRRKLRRGTSIRSGRSPAPAPTPKACARFYRPGPTSNSSCGPNGCTPATSAQYLHRTKASIPTTSTPTCRSSARRAVSVDHRTTRRRRARRGRRRRLQTLGRPFRHAAYTCACRTPAT